MINQDPYPGRQLRSLTAAALLGPITRLIPGSAAVLGGKTAWAGPLAALPFLLTYAWLLSRLRRRLSPGEGLPELALRQFGPRRGRLPLLLPGGWLLLYCAFLLRSGAERLQVTCYPRTSPTFFVVCLGLLATLAALGSFRSLLRLGRMVEPLLLGVLLLILLSAFSSLDPTELLPLSLQDAPALLCSAFPSLDLIGFALALLSMFPQAGEVGGFRRTGLWTCGLCLLLTALGAAVQGRLGASLSARFAVPFFALVRNLVFFRSLERVEAMVAGLWILPEFLLGGICLHGAQRCLRLALSDPPQDGVRRLDLGKGRGLIWLCGGIAIGLGLLLGRDPVRLLLWSRTIIPWLNLAASFLLIPGLFLLGKRKKKL